MLRFTRSRGGSVGDDEGVPIGAVTESSDKIPSDALTGLLPI